MGDSDKADEEVENVKAVFESKLPEQTHLLAMTEANLKAAIKKAENAALAALAKDDEELLKPTVVPEDDKVTASEAKDTAISEIIDVVNDALKTLTDSD